MFLHELTREQQVFASERHGLIHGFLRNKKLPFDDYYDVVVFGYLRAVRQYCTRPDLRRQFSFCTIAYRKMQDDLAKHFKKQHRPSCNAVLISLSSPLFEDEEFVLEDTLAIAEKALEDMALEGMDAKTLWNQMADLLTEEQIEALRLRVSGYSDREIAARINRRPRDIEEIFDGIRGAVLEVCII